MKERINPVGLKGSEITERMKELMGMTPINENRKTSVVELTKVGPDGNVYGIVRENHEYYIKVTSKKSNLVSEDFSYIGGLKNKKQEAYPSYAKAIKHLNLKFNSLNEAYGKSDNINVFEDDNLLKEDIAGFSGNMGTGFKNEGNLEDSAMQVDEESSKNNPWAICTSSVGREDKEKYEKCVKDVKKEKGIKEEITEAEYNDEDTNLNELEQSVEDMKEGEEDESKVTDEIKEHKLSIKRAIDEMDEIIDSIVTPNKKKVYTLK